MKYVEQNWREWKKYLTSSWEYYNALNEILGNKPATHPPVIIDSGSAESEGVDNFDDVNDFNGSKSTSPEPKTDEEKPDTHYETD